ncbi:type II toxin-antitoxin system ParD family antitoxin [Nostoc sp. FACHB-190]|uniref:type II toxin-antitoxin system ParD family antitoxin n=1 Tax=Nostoc sp. FACHB-190 TaxID=2692838 RepID=UPI0016865ED9|nr:type II toxin-antitoxin system ParD family antitoxin [Nostoc sp. FACHB-190]MBD2298910.1 type II toxin-antitoxin system ParD family antitoxin [Nostoc sp. FACHB-190]
MKFKFNRRHKIFIEEKLSSGRYHTIEEIIIEALELLEEHDKKYEQWLEAVRKSTDVSIAELERVDNKFLIAQLERKLRQALES